MLNPTGGVTAKPPVGLDYKKDPTRPGGGVFVAHGQAAREGDFKDVPAGVVISSSSVGSDTGEAASALAMSSTSAPSLAMNDRYRAFFSSSSFAPPLPDDHTPTPPSPSSLPPMHRGLGMVSSSMRSTANMPPPAPPDAGSSSMMTFSPIGRRSGGYNNLNPAMNMQMQAPGNVQVMNLLDQPQGGNTLHEQALTDGVFLEGMPGGMFDWGASRICN